MHTMISVVGGSDADTTNMLTMCIRRKLLYLHKWMDGWVDALTMLARVLTVDCGCVPSVFIHEGKGM